VLVVLVIATTVAIVVAIVFLGGGVRTVPDLTTQTVDQAATALASAGLRLGKTSDVTTTTVGAGRIVRQQPGPGTQVRKLTVVDVSVATTPVPAPVPDVTGKSSGEAQQALKVAQYRPVQVDVFGVSAEIDTVVSEVPSAGVTWLTGRPVAIAVSAGQDDGTGVKVPNITGKTVDVAIADLAKAGLAWDGFVTNIETPRANVVTAQLPGAGVLVRPGTTVLLLAATP
jgi:serine/threonine-protein kinase